MNAADETAAEPITTAAACPTCGSHQGRRRESTYAAAAGDFRGKPFDLIERHWMNCTECNQVYIETVRTFKGKPIDPSTTSLAPPIDQAAADAGVDVLEPEAAGDQVAAMQRLKDAADRIEQRAIDAETAAGETELPTLEPIDPSTAKPLPSIDLAAAAGEWLGIPAHLVDPPADPPTPATSKRNRRK
jgi:polygalacturonase